MAGVQQDILGTRYVEKLLTNQEIAMLPYEEIFIFNKLPNLKVKLSKQQLAQAATCLILWLLSFLTTLRLARR